MNSLMPSLLEPGSAPLTSGEKVKPSGKFFHLNADKFILKGVTYGPFAPSADGVPFPERRKVELDFSLISELGANTLRTFTPPPKWLLDRAAVHGLRIIAGIPWAQHIAFLDSARTQADIRKTIAYHASAGRGHPALFAHLVGNEISPEIVRWYGAKRVRNFLRELVDVVKTNDPDALVSYANFPSTEYLETEFTDFLAFNVYLHREQDFRRYLSHLHNLAADRPLVLTEIGMDSIREGVQSQAEALSRQLRAGFEMGVAGSVIFSWTDDWHAFSGPEGFAVEDWAFGLVDRMRRRKPSFWAVKKVYTDALPPSLPSYPKVSVIVCAYNGERTMDRCLASLETLNYPDYEVIVVNDGSTDRTKEISERYKYVQLVNQDNQGLSAARNSGLRAATGDIIAYTDCDCMVDPDWLMHLAARFLTSDFGAVGGPNLPPPDSSMVANCVAVSPGAPAHVLLDDEVAEHIPGCNMAFRREALEAIDGFDPLFRAAGDDVDVCWRLQNKGYKIGFSAAAVVWHFRRNTVRDYVKQQEGYGKAEALLYFKHPTRFNVLGQSRWFGRIYGDLSSFVLTRQPRIYSGVFGRGLFQTLYQPPSSLMSCLPLTLEWNLVSLLLILCAFLFGGFFWLGLLPFGLTVARCLTCAFRARIAPPFDAARAKLLVALLIFLGPLVRTVARYRWRMRRLREVRPIDLNGPTQSPRILWRERAFHLSYWNEEGKEKESLLNGVMEFLMPRKYLIAVDQGWSGWDLEICQGPWAKAQIRMATENHGSAKRLIRVRCALRMSKISVGFLSAYILAAALAALLGMPMIAWAAILTGLAHAGVILQQKLHIGHALYHVIESVAHKLEFVPVQKSSKEML